MRRAEIVALDPAPLPRLGEVLEFMRLVWALDHSLRRTSKRMKARIGLTGPQRLVVRIVGRFPGMPAGQLARLLHVHPSTLTGVLKRLERERLIRKRPDPRDARRSLLGLTAKGRERDTETEGTVESAVQRALREVPRAKLAAAREVLGSVARALEADRRR
jgi:DNA-binding MarR family transcriptional regulator